MRRPSRSKACERESVNYTKEKIDVRGEAYE